MSAEIKTGSRTEAGVTKQFFQLPRAGGRYTGLAPAGDGKRFLVFEDEQQNQEALILVVLNWAAELKQQ